MWLSRYGNVVIDEWRSTAQKRDYVILDVFVVMPNHFHAIIFIQNSPSFVGTWRAMSHKFSNPAAKSLSSIIGGFKSAVTKEINRIRNTPGSLVWQSRFYEHIIRDERDLNIHREYIINNPAKWSEDEENPFRK